MTEPTAIIPQADAALANLTPELEAARGYASEARARNTRRAYRADWNDFAAWCNERGIDSLPASPTTLAAYIADLAQQGRKPATIDRRMVTIRQMHERSGFDSPTQHKDVKDTLKGIKKYHGTAQVQKAPIVTDTLRAMVATLGGDAQGMRDRALLLVGFAGAFRRSELVGLDVADVRFVRSGMVVTVRRSKTDQEGKGAEKFIASGKEATCPVRALKAWLEKARISEGAIFRPVDRYGHVRATRLSGEAVAQIVKHAAEAAGLPAEDFAGHSLRAGLVTSAAVAGVAEREIMNQTGHKSERMVRKYIREADLIRENVSGRVGL